jgi:hypothetical protein
MVMDKPRAMAFSPKFKHATLWNFFPQKLARCGVMLRFSPLDGDELMESRAAFASN